MRCEACRSGKDRVFRRKPPTRASAASAGSGACEVTAAARQRGRTKASPHHTYTSAILLLGPSTPAATSSQSHKLAMPDVNTIPMHPRPPSYSQRPRRISISDASHGYGPPSPRSPSLSSLQAAATINAGLQRSPSSGSPARNNGLERRRSSLMNNLSLNDPAVPAPGEMQTHSGSISSSPRADRRSIALGPTADPHHARQPSLGELHQELEAETEGQVNRLLHMIRIQQDQLATLQRQNNDGIPTETSPTTSDFAGLPTPSSTLSPSHIATPVELSSPPSGPIPGASQAHSFFNRPHNLSRNSSSRLSNAGTSSRTTSPALRPSSGSIGPLTEDFLLGGTRDESAFYQAETHMLTRENQMLKQRIRDLGEHAVCTVLTDLSMTDTVCRTSNSSNVAAKPNTWRSDKKSCCSISTSDSSSRHSWPSVRTKRWQQS